MKSTCTMYINRINVLYINRTQITKCYNSYYTAIFILLYRYIVRINRAFQYF